MPTITVPVWDKNARTSIKEESVNSEQVAECTPFAARTANGFKDITSITFKPESPDKPGRRILVDRDYHKTCRELGIKARGKSGVPDATPAVGRLEDDLRAAAAGQAAS